MSSQVLSPKKTNTEMFRFMPLSPPQQLLDLLLASSSSLIYHSLCFASLSIELLLSRFRGPVLSPSLLIIRHKPALNEA